MLDVSLEPNYGALLPPVSLAQDGGYTLRKEATPFTQNELYRYLAGMTQVSEPNGAFYDEDATLDILWDGVRETGTWSVTSDGEVCWHIEARGELSCGAYYHNGDVVSIVYEDQTRPAPKRYRGNLLDSLHCYSTFKGREQDR